MEPNGCPKATKRVPAASPKRVFSGLGEKKETLTKPEYLLCFSHICQPRHRRISYKFGVSKRCQSREPPKLLTHCSQNLAIRVPGEPRAGKGSQPSPQRDSKRDPKSSPNRPFQKPRRTGDPQRSPRALQGPPGSQKWTKNMPKSLKFMVDAPLQVLISLYERDTKMHS